ncbi:uncharacterized protein LOC106159631 [Lingula anatina]|uniref:Uncharacterized protein LOC106159631 n=1 Tax=Lingula anatina TaxID=7574 RepID=A0A1S3I0Q3_LINAN|nr:uncharacterized protein LOC106159631 [Lingula anatina]|eukprot:XP_013391406.1 uncharacterized protein LOC106159631 [Lingula anatina]
MASSNTTGSEEKVGKVDCDQDEVLELGRELENKCHELVESAKEASKYLHSLADEIDEHYKRCNRGKIVGSTLSLVGFPLIAVGFGLSFVTFGASLGLSIAGAILSGAGGITAAGSGLAEHFITKARCRAAQEAVNAVHEKAEAYNKSLEKLKKMVPSSGFFSAVRHTGSLASNAASGVGTSVINSARLFAGVADDAAATVFRGLSTGLRVVHIGGFVLSALLVPYDIYTLASSSVKEHRKTGSEQANKIRELARKIAQVFSLLDPEDIGWLNLFS